jgi:hypothetical protein
MNGRPPLSNNDTAVMNMMREKRMERLAQGRSLRMCERACLKRAAIARKIARDLHRHSGMVPRERAKRDPRDQTRNLEIPGSMLRIAPE